MAALVNTAYAEHETGENDNGTEFHVVDDLYVGGWGGSINDPDAEIYGFTMFGSSGAYNTRYTGEWAAFSAHVPSYSTGAVVILGNLAVGSTAYFHRGVEFNAISTFTAGAYFPNASKVNFVSGSSVTFENAGNIYINGGSSGKALFYDASGGGLKWDTPNSYVSGDSLGSHIATQTLNMSNFPIINVSSIGFSNSALYISSGSAYFGGKDAGITVSTNVEVAGQIKAAKFIGDGSGLTGISGGDNLGNHIATKTLDMAGYNIIHLNELQWGSGGVKISSAAPQFGGEGAGVYISTNAQVNGQLYVGTTTVNGQLNVTGNATIGDTPASDVHTINGEVTVKAAASSGNKFMLIKDENDIAVAYFKRK